MYYLNMTDINNYQNNIDIVNKGIKWATAATPIQLPNDYYCSTRDTFLARLETLISRLEKQIAEDAFLLTAIIGEIGNNSFDHNLGNWKDVPGIYFAYDFDNKTIVLADRGQGIKKTIRRVKPEIQDDQEALNVAFTQTISGRSPEKRGNGLKFVVKVLEDKPWTLSFSSGEAQLTILPSQKLKINKTPQFVFGCFAIIRY